MRKTSLSLILFGLLLGFSLPTTSAQAQATRTWVSGVGDDVNPCSRTAPCKTFAGAISKTAAGGEIDCLDPGGFGAVTIGKSLTIDCGTFAGGILAASVNGVIVNGGANDKIVLRNLVIQGTISVNTGINGIRYIGGKELQLDRVVVQGFTTLCVDVNTGVTSALYVRNSLFTECPTAINLQNSAGGLIATVDNSMVNGTGSNGIVAASGTVLANISRSVFTNISGVAISSAASGSKMNGNDNVISNCGTGASVVAGGNLRLASNNLYDNSNGITMAVGASFLSDGKNNVSGGTAGATPTGTIPTR
jgi:hypothetical protein